MDMHFPDQKQVDDLFTMLLGKRCKIGPAKPQGKRPGDAAALGVYVDDEGNVVGAIICDITLAGSAGTALSMLPPKLAADCVKTKKIPPNVAENLYEVLNVGASLYNGARALHVKLREVVLEPERPPKEIKAILRKPSKRLDLSVQVAGYDPGSIHLLAA
ncbi:MAG: hypothetical protein VX899_13220 [Myxococcota bacterium]|nr:hypothetical protein [Myxococcota bacterium]